MRRGACCPLFLSLAACDALGVQEARQIELAGEWDWMDGHTLFPNSCGSDTTFQFEPDGRYYTWGISGTWSLKGEVFTMTITDFDPLHQDIPPEEINKPHMAILRWVDPNTFVTRDAGGAELTFRCCPDQN